MDPSKGLSSKNAEERIKQFGSNFRAPPDRTPFYKFVLNALEDFMLRLLLVCACVSIILDVSFADAEDRSHGNLFSLIVNIAWIEGFAIFVAVFIVTFVGSYNDYKKEEQFIALQKISDSKNLVTVLRDGSELDLHHNNILVGDIIKVKSGQNIPVDGVLIDASGVTCNEAAMTGESDDLKKESIESCMLRKHEKE